MKKVLFIDRDGTIIVEPPIDYQVDSLEKLQFLPSAITALSQIAKLDYFLAMVSNQDGLGTDSFPTPTFEEPQNKMLSILEGEGVKFDAIHIDPSFEHENSPCRKPGIGMLTDYFDEDFDLAASYVIGDRYTDVQLANNLGARAILIAPKESGLEMLKEKGVDSSSIALITEDWNEIYAMLRAGERIATVSRNTKETKITTTIDLDRSANPKISTGVGFFDHMLEQIAYHGGVDIKLSCIGDLEVDAHHTVEDCGIVLGEAFAKALGNKMGIERYGYALPMDESSALVLLDFGGRNDFVWDVEFTCDMLGALPTEMIRHFFKSFSDAARCNIQISARGENNHHKAEAVFKGFARALKCAIKRDKFNYSLPSSKGVL
ncbi:MAG: bifunctional histidinol-phosphatase/imidazoleglycerol-phosphate dehydratase HisB [Rikenellaceae bacterium]